MHGVYADACFNDLDLATRSQWIGRGKEILILCNGIQTAHDGAHVHLNDLDLVLDFENVCSCKACFLFNSASLNLVESTAMHSPDPATPGPTSLATSLIDLLRDCGQLHHAIPRTLHHAIPRSLHHANPRTLHHAIPRTLRQSVPHEASLLPTVPPTGQLAPHEASLPPLTVPAPHQASGLPAVPPPLAVPAPHQTGGRPEGREQRQHPPQADDAGEANGLREVTDLLEAVGLQDLPPIPDPQLRQRYASLLRRYQSLACSVKMQPLLL